MNLEDTQHNLRIIGKIFLILGFLILPISILSYNSIHFLVDSDWYPFREALDFGIFSIHFPHGIFYGLPAFHGLISLILIAAGIGLIYNLKYGKKLAYVPGIVALFFFPFGTALGLFLIFLLGKEREKDSQVES